MDRVVRRGKCPKKTALDCLWKRRKPRSPRTVQSPVRLQSVEAVGMHGLQDMYRPDGISASRLTPLPQAFCGSCRSGVSREAHEPSNHRFDCDPQKRLACADCRTYIGLMECELRGLRRSYKRCPPHCGWIRTSASRSVHAATGRSSRQRGCRCSGCIAGRGRRSVPTVRPASFHPMPSRSGRYGW